MSVIPATSQILVPVGRWLSFLYLSCDDPYDFARLLHHTQGLPDTGSGWISASTLNTVFKALVSSLLPEHLAPSRDRLPYHQMIAIAAGLIQIVEYRH